MQQKKVFFGGLNSDATDELMPEGDSRYRLNVRVLSSDNATNGAIETVKGNTPISFASAQQLPAGTNTCIGSKEWLIRKKIYFFVHNSNGDHTIWEYSTDSTAVLPLSPIKLVLQDSGLNFSTSKLITSINFIELDADNHLMYWTDNYNEPRKINIEKGIKYSITPFGSTAGGYETPFDIKWISRIKTPPVRPSYSWANDAAIVVNNLLDKNYQFKLQYVYDDNDISAWSMMSIYEFPQVTYITNKANDAYTQFNKIIIDFNTGSSIVKKIRISAKETNETDFSLITEIDKTDSNYLDNVQETFIFLNDGLYLPIEVNESIKLYDNVPLLSQTHDIISGNRLADGNITEGYDAVDIDMQMELGFQDVDNSQPNPKDITDNSFLKSGGTYTYGIVYYD